jgi:hypothetical protein
MVPLGPDTFGNGGLHPRERIGVDQRVVFLGSQNLSRQSLFHNRELGIITQSPGIVASVGRTSAVTSPLPSPTSPDTRHAS